MHHLFLCIQVIKLDLKLRNWNHLNFCYQAPPDSPSDAREALRRAAVEAAKVKKGVDLFAENIFFEFTCMFKYIYIEYL